MDKYSIIILRKVSNLVYLRGNLLFCFVIRLKVFLVSISRSFTFNSHEVILICHLEITSPPAIYTFVRASLCIFGL